MALFISFEGPDGSGKSTQLRLLAAALRQPGFRVLETREPGGTALGERVRDITLGYDGPPATPLAMTLLLSAARAQHVSEVIRPALESGMIVLTDRFADSTLAYQSHGLGLDEAVARRLSDIATGGLYPDVVVFVDIDPSVGLKRTATRGTGNRLDDETLSFHERVRAGYITLAHANPKRWITVDGDGSIQDVHEVIVQALTPLLPEVARTT